MFCKTGALKNFAKFTEKHLCQSVFFNKVAGLREIFKSIFFIEQLQLPAAASKLNDIFPSQ